MKVRIMSLEEYKDKFRKKLDKIGKRMFDSLLEKAKEDGLTELKVVGGNRNHKVYATRNKPIKTNKASKK